MHTCLIETGVLSECSSLYVFVYVCSDVSLHMLTTSCVLFIHYRGARVNVFFMFTKMSNVLSVEIMLGGHTEGRALADELAGEDFRKIVSSNAKRKEDVTHC